MKNKKGFTLVELLAVLMLLGLIVVIAIPTINTSLNAAKERAKKVQENIILNAAKDFAAEHFKELEEKLNIISINDLINENYIDTSNAENIIESDYKDKCVYVKYDKSYSQFDYSIIDCNSIISEDCFLTRTLMVEGENYIAITGYTWDNLDKCPLEVVIPDELSNLPLYKIDDNAFNRTSENVKLSKIVLSYASNLKEIGKNAFAGNHLQELVNISSSIEIIDEGAFQNNLISKIDFRGTRFKNIYANAFKDNFIENLNISNLNDLILLGDGVFENNLIKLVDLSNLENLTIIGASAFKNNQIEVLKILNSSNLNSIGQYAFKDNYLNVVSLGNLSSLVSIGKEAFRNNLLSSVNLSSLPTLETIGEGAFQDNESISLLKLSEMPNLVEIGDYAFKNAGIYKIDISDVPSLITIGKEAFRNNNLADVNLEDTSILSIKSNCFRDNDLKKIVFPSTITTIEPGVLYISEKSNSELKSVYNPSNESFKWHYVFGPLNTTFTDVSLDESGIFGIECIAEGYSSGYNCKNQTPYTKYTVKIYNVLP